MVFVFSMLLQGCSSTSESSSQTESSELIFSLREPFNIKINQTAFIENENLQITFHNVSEDSRCPIGVECRWAGRALLGFEVLKNGKTVGSFLSGIGSRQLIPLDVERYGVEVRALQPYPVHGEQILQSEYLATFYVFKNGKQENGEWEPWWD